MRYSIEPKNRKYVKGYRFYHLLKISHANKVAKNMSNEYSQKLLIVLKILDNM